MEYIPHILSIIKDHWDVFATKGLVKPIWCFKFHVDIGPAKPICYSIPDTEHFKGDLSKNWAILSGTTIWWNMTQAYGGI